MKRTKHLYSDPTGGGDDITLEIPAWAEPPDSLSIRDVNLERHHFELFEEGFADDDDEDDPFGDGD